MIEQTSERAIFRRRLLSNPRQISAIAPSSRHLGAAMASGFGPTSGRVVEFGPGTGSISRALLRAGLPPSHLTLFELDPELATYLQTALPPGVTIHNAPAQTAAETPDLHDVDGVVSGLPLLSIPESIVHDLVSAAFRILAPGAPFVQFTYGPRVPLPAETIAKLGLRVERGERVLRNLPPARIYRFRRC
ncbi:class I SAM-dependent methyltransferase [Oceaniglobus trochenteri]|uniref:class I SAM-dependent methyltransferase n=1 Tax=Oceaniglobus trochenteri TaxID=2763260 RepID=UPI001D0007BB|nr:methyltransferase type 12 [Oceaniglobus trochenteri]